MVIRKLPSSFQEVNLVPDKKRELNDSTSKAIFSNQGLDEFLTKQGVIAFEKNLGQGGFGSVQVAQIKENSLLSPNSKVAIKKLLPSALNLDSMTFFTKERTPGEALPLLIDDEHVVKVYSVVTKDSSGDFHIRRKSDIDAAENERVCAVTMEYIEEASMPFELDPEPETVKTVLKSLLQGLTALHKIGIAHRDIKKENILLTKKGVKILDFGLAKQVKPENLRNSICGTTKFTSPEVILGGKLDQKADIWSTGVLVYEALFATTPFDQNADSPDEKIRQSILNYSVNGRSIEQYHSVSPFAEFSPEIDPKWWGVLNGFLNPVPELRPSAKEALNDEIFK